MRPAEFGFVGTPLRAELVAAVVRGEKTATAGLLVDYERDGDALPEVGERFLVLDNDDRGVAVIETSEVRVLRVGDCDVQFARDEGEGFESVADWRAAHDRFWRSYADGIRAYLGDPAWDVTDETEFVAERFRLVELL
ncbi:MAG: ASCH domain-containing protein [Actinobacteria bacterium]|nr:ASCH domain-containing protein [Actinomycetota bacterium]